MWVGSFRLVSEGVEGKHSRWFDRMAEFGPVVEWQFWDANRRRCLAQLTLNQWTPGSNSSASISFWRLQITLSAVRLIHYTNFRTSRGV